MTPRRLVMLVGLLGVGCDGQGLRQEEVDHSWCTATWLCVAASDWVSLATEEGCADGLVPAICLNYGETEDRWEEVYCHDADLFENACLYESACSWDEESGYYVIECTSHF